MAAAACRRTSGSPTPTRTRGRCASRTARTKCTATPSPSRKSRSRPRSPNPLPRRRSAEMKIGIPAALLALFGAAASAQEIQAPPAGTEFVMRCGSSESRWLVAENAGGKVRVQQASDPTIYRLGPAWGYLLGDIYDELGLGASGGKNTMSLLKGPAEGPKLQHGAKFRFSYKWSSPKGETERSHVISVQGPK